MARPASSEAEGRKAGRGGSRPRLRGHLKGQRSRASVRSHAPVFFKVFSCLSRARARTARKASTGAASSRFLSYPKPAFFPVNSAFFPVNSAFFPVLFTYLPYFI